MDPKEMTSLIVSLIMGIVLSQIVGKIFTKEKKEKKSDSDLYALLIDKFEELTQELKELGKCVNNLAIDNKSFSIISQKTQEDFTIFKSETRESLELIRGKLHDTNGSVHLVVNDFARYKARFDSLEKQFDKCQSCKTNPR